MFSSLQHRLTSYRHYATKFGFCVAGGQLPVLLAIMCQPVGTCFRNYCITGFLYLNNQSTSGVCSKRNLFINIRFLIGCNWEYNSCR